MPENLIGQTFNYLTVIGGPIIKRQGNKNRFYWECQCVCGNKKLVRSDLLKNGSTKSCGCYKNSILAKNNKERQILDLTGQKFGKLTAIKATEKRTKDGRVIWKCKCDCGNECEVDTHSLKCGNTQSCGCLKSRGELSIGSLLLQYNIRFETQKKFESCRFEDSSYLASFDFFVNGRYIIEYDGEQHFYYNNSVNSWNTKENLKKVQNHDKYKNQWCKEHNIPIIRIPYTHLKDLCIDDLILEKSQFLIK